MNPITGIADCWARTENGQTAVAPQSNLMNSRRLIVAPELGQQIVPTFAFAQEGADVRFGSEADMCSAKACVRFTPNSDRKSRHAANGHVRFTLKADMCGASADVCLGGVRLPRVRWVHVQSDGIEENFLAPPPDKPHIMVKVMHQTSSEVEEQTLTRDTDNGEPSPPPGRGWMNFGRTRDGSTRWWRKREL